MNTGESRREPHGTVRGLIKDNLPAVAAGVFVIVTFLVVALYAGQDFSPDDPAPQVIESGLHRLADTHSAPGELGVAGHSEAPPGGDLARERASQPPASGTGTVPELAHLPGADPVISPHPVPDLGALSASRRTEPFADPLNPTQKEMEQVMGRGLFEIDCPDLEVPQADARTVEPGTPSDFQCSVRAIDGFEGTVKVSCAEHEQYVCRFTDSSIAVSGPDPVDFQLSVTISAGSAAESTLHQVSFLGASGPKLKTSHVQGWVRVAPDVAPTPSPSPSPSPTSSTTPEAG